MSRKLPEPAAVDRQRRALELRRQGASYSTIASRLGYANKGGAHKLVRRALRATLQEPADELRRLETERLDALLRALWHKAIAGHGAAIDRVLKVMERRANLLGLDAPKKVQQTIDPAVRAIAAEVAAECDIPVPTVVAEAERIVRATARRRRKEGLMLSEDLERRHRAAIASLAEEMELVSARLGVPMPADEGRIRGVEPLSAEAFASWLRVVLAALPAREHEGRRS